MRRALLVLPVLVLALAGCGTKNVILPDKTADTIVKFVSKQTGFTPKDVSCPSDVEAKVGGTFDCHFTGPDGPYVVHMTIRKVDGERVLYGIDSVPDR